VSNNRFLYRGLDELKAQLRNLPAELGAEADHIVTGAGNGALSEVKQGYGAHVVTGHLLEHVGISHTRTAAGAISVMKSTSPHAFIFENGTQVRYTKDGRNRGAMPPFHVFIPAAVRARRLMNQQLVDLVRRQGLTVTGDV